MRGSDFLSSLFFGGRRSLDLVRLEGSHELTPPALPPSCLSLSPLPPASFDHAYAIEATCHSPTLEEVYGQVYKVLKPGGKFVSYEWVSTNMYDPKNEDHVKCIDAINYANALPVSSPPAPVPAPALALSLPCAQSHP